MKKKSSGTFKSRFPGLLSSLVNPVILLAYCFITVLTPRLDALDSGGTKFLALAIFNLGVFVFLQFRKDRLTAQKTVSDFFGNRIGLIYGLFMVVSLISFLKAINPAESLLAFTKLFTVFTSVLIIAAILQNNVKYVFIVAVGLSLLLLADALTVFYQIWKVYDKQQDIFLQFGSWTYSNILFEITSVYSNKNILASALFVKLPFALWLWSFRHGAAKMLGLTATFLGFIALLILNARAFFLGLALLTVVYLLFTIVRLLVDRKRWKSAIFSMIIVVLIPLFLYAGWIGLSHFFPGAGKFNLKDKISQRLETITQDMSRLSSWKRTLTLVREDPLLGVGTGNWKINVLKYESPAIPDYVYFYYNHNDFLQITAETGITGGLLFLAIFIGVGWAFVVALFKGSASGMSYEYLFIPAFGLLCYSVDAFFNFPHDRPEIQSLWAIFIGAAVACTPKNKIQSSKFKVQNSNFFSHIFPIRFRPVLSSRSFVTHVTRVTFFRHVFSSRVSRFFVTLSSRNTIAASLYLILLFGSLWLLYLNFRSLQLQALVEYELTKNELRTPASVFMTGFPAIPTMSVESEPVALMKARYLINEGKLAEAIDLLKSDRSSPWESRREVFISRAYMDLGNSDSALIYARRVYEIKPLFRDNILLLLTIHDEKAQYAGAIKILDAYIASGLADQSFVDQRITFDRKMKIQRVEAAWYMGRNFFDRKSYEEAASKFTEVISKEPDLLEAYDYRAFCYYHLKDYRKSLADVEHLIASGNKDPKIVNLQQELKRVIR